MARQAQGSDVDCFFERKLGKFPLLIHTHSHTQTVCLSLSHLSCSACSSTLMPESRSGSEKEVQIAE